MCVCTGNATRGRLVPLPRPEGREGGAQEGSEVEPYDRLPSGGSCSSLSVSTRRTIPSRACVVVVITYRARRGTSSGGRSCTSADGREERTGRRDGREASAQSSSLRNHQMLRCHTQRRHAVTGTETGASKGEGAVAREAERGRMKAMDEV